MNQSFNLFVALWNARVARRWLFSHWSDTHAHFVHPTKGKRKVAKSRLGVA